MYLLSPPATQAKMSKSSGIDNYLPYVMHLAPSTLSGYNTCPLAGLCKDSCLNTAGRGRFNNVQLARIARTKMFFEQRDEFFAMLKKEIDRALRRCDKQGKKLSLRLNGTSDIRWEMYKPYDGKTIFEAYPQVQFYDYTKLPNRDVDGIANYHLTFSDGGDNMDHVELALSRRMNVAVVFAGKILPEVWYGRKVIDGDKHDLRFLDPKGVIVGLTAKGKAKVDASNFVKDPGIANSQLKEAA